MVSETSAPVSKEAGRKESEWLRGVVTNHHRFEEEVSTEDLDRFKVVMGGRFVEAKGYNFSEGDVVRVLFGEIWHRKGCDKMCCRTLEERASRCICYICILYRQQTVRG